MIDGDTVVVVLVGVIVSRQVLGQLLIVIGDDWLYCYCYW